MKDRFARLNHGWEGDDCGDFSSDDEPDECDKGGDDAQDAAAWASLINNFLSFLFCPMFGAISDCKGRRLFILLGLSISIMPQIALVCLLEIDDLNPYFYYTTIGLAGCISWFAIMVAGVSDVIRPKYRTAAYGITSVGWGVGFSLAPCIAVPLSDSAAVYCSVTLLCCGFMYALIFIPETLSEEIAETNSRARAETNLEHADESALKRVLYQPFRHMKILNRNRLFRTMAIVNVLSSMAYSAEYTLVIYYVDDELDFSDGDIAIFFAISGLVGIITCAFLLKPLNDIFGERLLLVYAFMIGAFHDVLYAFAKTAWIFFLGGGLFGLANVSWPAIASIKANNVDEREYGIINGALVSVSSLSAAIGPWSFRAIYYSTDNTEFPGSMFLLGSCLFAAAGIISYSLPESQTNARLIEEVVTNEEDITVESEAKTSNVGDSTSKDLTQPLLTTI